MGLTTDLPLGRFEIPSRQLRRNWRAHPDYFLHCVVAAIMPVEHPFGLSLAFAPAVSQGLDWSRLGVGEFEANTRFQGRVGVLAFDFSLFAPFSLFAFQICSIGRLGIV